MSGILQTLIASIGGAITDTYFNLVTLLLPGNGTNGAQNNTFLDSSTNNFTITRNGNTTQGTFSPFSQTGWSSYNNSASNNNVGIYLNGQSDFAFGTGDFTIEMWVNLQSKSPGQIIYDSRPDGTQGLYPTIYVDGSTNQLKFFTNSADRITQTSTFTYNVWHHVVVTRTGTSTKMFVDGVQEGSTYTDSNNYINGALRPFTGDGVAPSPASNSYGVLGYISNLRVVKGSGPYQSAGSSITVPTSPLTPVTNTVLLTLQSNRFVDTNTQVAAKTINTSVTPSVQAFSPFAPTAAYSAATVGGSGYFDGSDWLTVGAASDWTFMHNGSDWTCEFWVYHTGTAAYTIASTTAFSAQIGFTIAINSTYASGLVNGAQLYIVRGDGVSEAVFNSTALLVPNQWNYVAITFTSSTKTCAFTINGASAGSTANTGFSYSSSNPTNTLAIGRFQGTSPSNYLVGYLGSLRISTNIRTGLTTVPTSPYTSDANTKLLTNYTNAGITDATAKNDLETVGNAQISTTQSKFGGSSMYFDGTGDYLFVPYRRPLNVGESTSYTVEFWARFSSFTTARCVVAMYQDATNRWAIEVSAGATNILFGASGATNFTNPSTLSTNTWYHFALVGNSAGAKLYIDGVASSTSNTKNIPSLSSGGMYIGYTNYTVVPGFEFYMDGYIDDLRITQGYARYTANFTPPTAAFPLQ